jgi:dihydrofolate reductase
MRRLIVSNLMSLDGFFEGPKNEIDWFVVEKEFLAYSSDMLRSVDTMLFGRRTYELMAAYWPSAPKDEIADQMNGLQKIVFSRTLSNTDWNNSRLIKGNIAAEVSALKQQAGKDMVVLGSAMLASFLLQEGLIDEYRIILDPIILSGGNPLFGAVNHRIKLKLKDAKPLASGVVILYYQKT